MSAEIIHGDCLAVMPTLGASSVDAIVCDPPYGLSFMGKDWDHGIPGVAFWREALRVAKPGAHLVAFGGTRTYHRLACAIEDAGWEIRDTLSWMYGSGFPKSLDVSKAMDKVNGETDRLHKFTAWMRTTRLNARTLDEVTGTAMGGHYLTAKSQPAIPTPELWARIRPLVAEAPEWVDELVQRIAAEREVIGSDDKGAAIWGSCEGEYDITAPATDLAKQWAGWGTALKPGWEPIILARKPLAGTVAQTVAQYGTGALNISATRITTGDDLNGGAYAKNGTERHDGTENWRYKREGGAGEYQQPAGRWPANVVLSHSPECRQVGTRRVKGHKGYPNGPGGKGDGAAWSSSAKGNSSTLHSKTDPVPGHADADGLETVPHWDCAPDCAVALLDAQSGERPSNNCGHGEFPGKESFLGAMKSRRAPGFGDTGGASRFYYVAKASRREREAGLEGMPAENDPRSPSAPGHSLRAGEWIELNTPSTPRANGHPTVKPLALMRWLCRLVTPPGGLILDPFTGSGSTGCAAVLEGFRFTGIEQDEAYCEIARRRIAHWAATVQPDLEPAA